MVLTSIICPTCHGTDVVKYGQTSDRKQRFYCQNTQCSRKTFLQKYVYQGKFPEVKQQIVDMTLNGSGVRDTARALHISTTTVIETVKKAPEMHVVNSNLLSSASPDRFHVVLKKVEEAERDEMWSFVKNKGQQRWLWHAIDHATGAVLAYVLGSHEDSAFLQLKSLLAPFHITRFYTDDWGAYQRHLPENQHEVGKNTPKRLSGST